MPIASGATCTTSRAPTTPAWAPTPNAKTPPHWPTSAARWCADSSQGTKLMTARPPIDISVAFATTLDTHELVSLTEQLGFARAWLYDTSQQSPDVWMCLAL